MTYAEQERDLILEHIDRYGRHIIGVFACAGDDDDTPPFAYTIGNWRQPNSLPELLVIGTSDAGFLNLLSAKMLERGTRFAEGEIVNLGGRHAVKIINTNASAQAEYTIQAGNFYGHDNYSVQQALVPDRRGRFPDDPQCEVRYRMPVLARQ